MVKSSGNQAIPFQEKQEEMNELYKSVQITARDKQNQLQDILKEVREIGGIGMGLQERRNSSALAKELRLSCTNPSIWVA